MSYRPFISVVIPTYNRARQVQAALNSVLRQTYREFEVLVVDDGSSDGTRETVQEIIDNQPTERNQIHYFFQANQGQSVARNKGTREARGEWVAFLDSDDVWLPEKLEWQVRAIGRFKDKSCACITDVRMVDDCGMDKEAFRENGRSYPETLGVEPGAARTLVKSRDPFWVSSLLVRTEVFKQVGWFDPNIGYAEDHDLLFRLSLATEFCYVNQLLCVTDRSTSPEDSRCRPWDQVDVRLKGTQLMFEKWLRLENLPADVRKTIVQNLRNVYSAWANWYLEHEKYEEARQAARKAIDYELTAMLAVKWSLMHVAPSLARRIAPKMRVL